MEMHIQAVNAFTKQLRINYGANIKHTSGITIITTTTITITTTTITTTTIITIIIIMLGDTPECQAATQLFITNGANLMNSIKEVIKSSKSSHSLPNNQLAVMSSSLTQPHGQPPTQPHCQPPSQTLPHSSTATALTATQGIYIIVQLVSCFKVYKQVEDLVSLYPH